MSDLRKKVLSGGGKKTISRKAQSKMEAACSWASLTPTAASEESRGRSPATSKASSHAPSSHPSSVAASRYASDAEDDGASHSSDELSNSASDDIQTHDQLSVPISEHLQSRLDEIQTRKRGVKDREASLAGYVDFMRRHYISEDTMRDLTPFFISAFLKSVTAGDSARERLLGVEAIIVTTLTHPWEEAFGRVSQAMKGLCHGTEEDKVKAQAIHALSVTVLYGGGLPAAHREMLDYLIEIIETDGASVDSEDSAVVVTAALQAWALVATYVEDLGEDTEHALEVFMDQLDSTEVDVQTSAGSNIGLLFEAARDYEEETGISLNLEYEQHKTVTRMSEIIKVSPKATGKKDRRCVRSNFTSVITSLERRVGPGYSVAGRGSNPHTGGRKMESDNEFHEFGYKEKIRVNSQQMVIDTWALQARAHALKAHLRLGFGEHFALSPTVQTILEDGTVEEVSSPSAIRRGRQVRVFEEGEDAAPAGMKRHRRSRGRKAEAAQDEGGD